MSEKIEPALTAEEWEKRQSWSAAVGAGDALIVGPEDCPHWVENVDRHAVAALALYGQPFGFTREDVTALRKEYDAIMDAQSDEFWDSGVVARAEVWKSLADRIEALLPPREALRDRI